MIVTGQRIAESEARGCTDDSEHRELRAHGDHRLAGTKHTWLRNTAAMSSHSRETLPALKDSGLKVARAWAIKEMAMDLRGYQSRAWAVGREDGDVLVQVGVPEPARTEHQGCPDDQGAGAA